MNSISKAITGTIYYVMMMAVIGCQSGTSSNTAEQKEPGLLFIHANLIDGNGEVRQNQRLLVEGNIIMAIGDEIDSTGHQVIDLAGKTIMPALISTHVHIGTTKGTENDAAFYTRDHILHQLEKYQEYGVLTVLTMGSDRPLLFETGIRDSSIALLLPGARMYSAGYGFGTANSAPPASMGMDQVYRPATAAEVPAQMDSLAALKPKVVKLWVDDFGGKLPKMDTSVYKAIIEEAHKHGLRAAAHVYYLADAKRLLQADVDVFAHSIRDTLVDDELIKKMKNSGTFYIPTLSLDEFAYSYARKPDWLNDDFFRASLEPGVYEMVTSSAYQDKLKKAPDYEKNVQAFETALQNLKKIFDSGILVALGTDSGALPIRPQGFSEHLELELMTQAGLSPLQAITIATKNSARMLGINNKYGTLEQGKTADFIVLHESPEHDIKNTRKIAAIYKAGKEVSKGPLK